MTGSWGPKAELKLTPAIGTFMPKQIKKIPNIYGTCTRETGLQLHSTQLINIFPSFYGT